MAATWTQHQRKAIKNQSDKFETPKNTTDNFNQLTKDTDIDIAFVQEPYIYQNQVTGITRNYKVFTGGSGRKRAAIVVVNI